MTDVGRVTGTAEERRTALAAVNKATGRIESCFTLGEQLQSLRCCISVEDVVIGEPIKWVAIVSFCSSCRSFKALF